MGLLCGAEPGTTVEMRDCIFSLRPSGPLVVSVSARLLMGFFVSSGSSSYSLACLETERQHASYSASYDISKWDERVESIMQLQIKTQPNPEAMHPHPQEEENNNRTTERIHTDIHKQTPTHYI